MKKKDLNFEEPSQEFLDSIEYERIDYARLLEKEKQFLAIVKKLEIAIKKIIKICRVAI
jgi:hypothetical protein